MASTKRVNVGVSDESKNLVVIQIKQLEEQLINKLELYKSQNNGKEYDLTISKNNNNITENRKELNYDFIRPSHYVQEDGRETWEHMLDTWSVEEVALWCEMTAYKYKDRMGKKPGEDEKREQSKIDWYDKKATELRNSIEKPKKSFW